MKPIYGHQDHHRPLGLATSLSSSKSATNDKSSFNDNATVYVKNLSKQYIIQSSSDNFPNYLTKDDPKPAVFIARKLFSDFVLLANRKIETVLAQETKDKPLYKALERNEDPIYDQILEALGAISEYCLPSLLSTLIDWYHHQLDVDENNQKQKSICLSDNQQQQALCEHQLPDCGSPCNETTPTSISISISTTTTTTTTTTNNNNTTIVVRSPTPSSPDTTSNQISILSPSPIDYQSPASLTVVGDPHSSAANTSTSTATNVSSNSLTEDSSNNIKRLELVKTRKLFIEFTFCQSLIEIFSQLHLHPGYEDLIGQIVDIAFEHFKYFEANELNTVDNANVNQLAGKYAEVIGVLAQTRFKLIKKRFMSELNELRAKEPTPFNIQCIVTLLSAIKFFRVKMAPIEEFESSLQFLQECADYFLEVRHKSIKHALAGLFVEIMVPLASAVKNEVKIPCLKNFVDTLWSPTLDMCSRKKHSITLFPLVTCLLCVSHRSFFLANWGAFLNMCLSNLKNRDQKMCRVALESLYRLIWIYMIRVKCESNNITQARLQSIVDALFPRGSRTVVPRDASLNIFVDIIHFIAQERLDFAMRHIIFDLLSVDRPIKVILAPERMSIALQAFLVIADSLQHKEGDPPMPKSVSSTSLSSSVAPMATATISNGLRKSHASKMLNDDTAKSIGIYQYYSHIQRSFNDTLKALDTQYGRPLLLTNTHITNKEPDDMITSERKPKIDLFKTCVAAIPRLMPDGMSRADLIDLLSRMTVHVDEEMRKYAFESLQIFITDFPDWRLDAIEGFTLFLVTQIDESMRHLVDNASRMLLHFLVSWRTTLSAGSSGFAGECGRSSWPSIAIQTGYETISSRNTGQGGQIAARKHRALAEMRLIQSELNNTRFDRLVSVVQKVEGAAWTMQCSCHQPTRRLASHLLRESRAILRCYASWTCMEQFGFRSPDEVEEDGEDDLSASLRGSLSADNLSRIVATSTNGPAHSSSVTSMNTQAMLSTSISKMCLISNSNNNNNNLQQHCHHQQQLFDSEIENNLAECFIKEDSSSIIFRIAVIMLESDNEQQYMLALRLLKKILPSLPFEQPEFVEEVDRNLSQMRWAKYFPGIHALILKGCTSSTAYDISIALLDHLTPILGRQPIGNVSFSEDSFPFHVIVLLTHLLANYEDPTAFDMNIARRIAIWCDENSQKLENLSTVMTLYSRRSFSKDGFQWTKCVVKYLYDAYPLVLPNAIPLLVEMLEGGPQTVQRLIAPILYCILNYVDVSSSPGVNANLSRIYNKYLGDDQWKDAMQIFKLIISRSSCLANTTSHGRELPGRTMDFTFEVESIPVIAADSD